MLSTPIIPQRGESLTAAIIRVHQGNTGLSEMDRMCVGAQDRAADRATIAELRQALADAHELIDSLQEQLESARCFEGAEA